MFEVEDLEERLKSNNFETHCKKNFKSVTPLGIKEPQDKYYYSTFNYISHSHSHTHKFFLPGCVENKRNNKKSCDRSDKNEQN